MKKTMLLIILVAFAIQGYAQPSADFLGIGIGAGIPVGGFAATNSDYYNRAGFATTGGSFNINYVHKFNEWFGLAVTNFNSSNSINANKLLDVSGENSMNIDRMSNASCLLVGGYFKQKDFPIYGKVMIGFGAVQTAGMTLYDNGGVTVFQQSDPAYGFAYSIGAGAFLPLSYRWALTLSLDFVSCLAKPSVTVIDNGNFSQGPTLDYDQNFINAQVGIGYMFGPRYHRVLRKRPVEDHDRRMQY